MPPSLLPPTFRQQPNQSSEELISANSPSQRCSVILDHAALCRPSRYDNLSDATVAECLTSEESKTLLELCRVGRLYEIERWIASGKSTCTPPTIKKTPLLTAVDRGFHSLVELLARNESRPEHSDRALSAALAKKRLDLIEVLVEGGARIQAIPLEDVLLTWDRSIMWFFLDRGADVLTGNPFAMAFREKVQMALRPFVEYRKAHPEMADALQAQADSALRHFAPQGDLKWISLMLWAGAPFSPATRWPSCFSSGLCHGGRRDAPYSSIEKLRTRFSLLPNSRSERHDTGSSSRFLRFANRASAELMFAPIESAPAILPRSSAACASRAASSSPISSSLRVQIGSGQPAAAVQAHNPAALRRLLRQQSPQARPRQGSCAKQAASPPP